MYRYAGARSIPTDGAVGFVDGAGNYAYHLQTISSGVLVLLLLRYKHNKTEQRHGNMTSDIRVCPSNLTVTILKLISTNYLH